MGGSDVHAPIADHDGVAGDEPGFEQDFDLLPLRDPDVASADELEVIAEIEQAQDLLGEVLAQQIVIHVRRGL